MDLSLPQVAGSAVAAVAAAVMASQLGVYGTILGAGVMSVVATCGGSFFQHFFRRTGEQIREVTVQVTHPAGRQVTVRTRETTGPARAERLRADEATTVLRTVDPDRTRPLASLPGHARLPEAAPPYGAFTEGGTQGTRIRGWKRSALVAVAVFVMAMAGITTYELISGNDLSGGRGTTVGSVVGGDERSGTSDGPAPSDDSGAGTGAGQDANRDDEGEGTRTAPGAAPGDGGDRQEPDPARSESPSTGPSSPDSSGDEDTVPDTTPAPSEPGAGATVAPEPTGSAAGGAPAEEDGTTADPQAG